MEADGSWRLYILNRIKVLQESDDGVCGLGQGKLLYESLSAGVTLRRDVGNFTANTLPRSSRKRHKFIASFPSRPALW